MVNIFVDPKTKKGLLSSYWKTLKCQKKISLEEKDKGSECLSETLITKGIDHSSFFPFSFFFFFSFFLTIRCSRHLPGLQIIQPLPLSGKSVFDPIHVC